MRAAVDAGTLEAELRRARTRTAKLLEPLSDEQLVHQVSPLMSPLVWDLAHIGHFEELWLLRRLAGHAPRREEHDEVYDAFAHERSKRGELPSLSPHAARAYVDDVRQEVLAVLGELRWDNSDPLLERGFVVGMVVQHELQHVETMTQTLQLGRFRAPAPTRPPDVVSSGEILVEASASTLGAGREEPWAYDNERPAHEISGGYRDRSAWSDAGWAWREAERAEAPLFWERDCGRWRRRRFDLVEPVPAPEPVQHVSFYEADAYARWSGKRLPSEPEWEKAARTAGDELEHAQGAVWQWTSSHFTAYPGFRAFPYPEYSEVFFGTEYRVLRGGSWVTDPLVARPTFRNWDYPQRRQIFSGIRCARDA